MNFFDLLTLIGGLSLFLFGMNLMSSSLEKRAGHRLKALMGSMTSTPVRGFALGVIVTALMQSSSVTTVMVVGFVNSGILTLAQSVSIIIGANLGAAVTSWLLSLAGIEGSNFFIQLLKPSSFTPILALAGVIMYVFRKNAKKKETGAILLGFSVLMFGMETMSGAVSGLRQAPEFYEVLSVLSNPIIGVLVGTAITALIQSSSASIGILQALSTTGAITYGSAIPIVLGANTGTCISALISCIGASRNAKRAAVIHLLFNVISTIVVLPLYYVVYHIFSLGFSGDPVNPVTIALISTVYKIISIVILSPAAKYLEPLSRIIIKDAKEDDQIQLLDERLFKTPSVAIARCKTVAYAMAELSFTGILYSLNQFSDYDESSSQEITDAEDKVDYYEDKLGSYLVKLSGGSMSRDDHNEASKLLHLISDIERISDHSVSLLSSAEEIHEKRIVFSDDAIGEINCMVSATREILDLALAAFRDDDMNSAAMVEPLEQVLSSMKERIRSNHIARLQTGACTIEQGFIITDIITDLERVSDHCSNIAGCVLEMAHENMDLHAYLHGVRNGGKEYESLYDYYSEKYAFPKAAE